MDQREHRLQAFSDRFIDRVMLPPFWTTGIDHASNTTDNARARARGRGVKPGIPDVYVIQGNPARCVWIELKRGSKLSESQIVVHHAMAQCEVLAFVAHNIHDVLSALQLGGFRLHGNAKNISMELEEKLDAADRAITPRRISRTKPSSVRKPTANTIASFESIRAKIMP